MARVEEHYSAPPIPEAIPPTERVLTALLAEQGESAALYFSLGNVRLRKADAPGACTAYEQALALELPIPVTVDAALPGRPPAPVESAAYFAIAEFLANVVKHSGAQAAWVVIAAPQQRLRLQVGDDALGGADLRSASGSAGIARRLAAFDGTMARTGPAGVPAVGSV